MNEFTLVPAGPCFPEPRLFPGVSSMNYDGFTIESFEAGRGLWHARIRRADLQPVVLDGVSFASLEVGFAWSTPTPRSPMPRLKSITSTGGSRRNDRRRNPM